MFGFIAFGFKIIFAAVIGGAINYIPGKISDRHKIVETSLICIFGAAILALSSQIAGNDNSIPMGFGIIAVIMGVIYISKNKDFIDRMIWYFAAVSGMIIGSGYIFQACILILLIYIILHNSERLLNYLDNENYESDEKIVENITN